MRGNWRIKASHAAFTAPIVLGARRLNLSPTRYMEYPVPHTVIPSDCIWIAPAVVAGVALFGRSSTSDPPTLENGVYRPIYGVQIVMLEGTTGQRNVRFSCPVATDVARINGAQGTPGGNVNLYQLIAFDIEMRLRFRAATIDPASLYLSETFSPNENNWFAS